MGLYLDIALIAIFAGIVIFNFIRGFIKALAPFKKWAAIAIAWMIKTPVSQVIGSFIDVEALKKSIYDRAYSVWNDEVSGNIGETVTGELATGAENMANGFLEKIMAGLRDAIGQSIQEGAANAAHDVSVFVSENLTNIILQGAAFVAGFVVLMLLFTITLKLVDGICKNNILGVINRICGGVLGLVIGILAVWIVAICARLLLPELVDTSSFGLWMIKDFFLSKFFGIG